MVQSLTIFADSILRLLGRHMWNQVRALVACVFSGRCADFQDLARVLLQMMLLEPEQKKVQVQWPLAAREMMSNSGVSARLAKYKTVVPIVAALYRDYCPSEVLTQYGRVSFVFLLVCLLWQVEHCNW